jgi:hypothetical protein
LKKSEPFFGDIGYSLPIPWPQVTTAGWWQEGPIPEERALITRSDPEYFALNDLVRTSGGLPEIDTSNPIYKFDRRDYTYAVQPRRNLANWGEFVAKQHKQEEREFKKVVSI